MKTKLSKSIFIDSSLNCHSILRDIDTDYFIDLNHYSVNLQLSIPFMSRVQFPSIRALLLRTSPHSHIITLHMLKDSDLYSSISNFELDLTHHYLDIVKDEHCITISIESNLNIE